ncbi:MAG: hypothetical protein HY850_11745 [Betaproteobacteria bacterium]|nr:hypothetical protein [Betaproteobacteria bacterium]
MTMPNLKSGISKEFKEGFILDEDGLRKLSAILEQHSQKLSHPSAVVFHVHREDDRFYETTSLDDVLQDPNARGRRIDLVGLELRDTSPDRTPEPWDRDWIVRIGFDKTVSRQVMFDIFTKDRNWALLLADDIEPQLTRTFRAKRIPTWLLVLTFLAIGGFLASALSLVPFPPFLPSFLHDALQVGIWFAVCGLCLTAIGRRDDWLSRWTGPESSFYWGDEAVQFANREEQRKHIHWVVIVGFLVSVGATVYTNMLEKATKTSPLTAPSSTAVPQDKANSAVEGTLHDKAAQRPSP